MTERNTVYISGRGLCLVLTPDDERHIAEKDAETKRLREALEQIASVNTRAGWPRRIAMEVLGRYADAPCVNTEKS